MQYLSSSRGVKEKSGFEDYEKLFRSPTSSNNTSFSSVPPIEPTPLSLDGWSRTPNDRSASHLISPSSIEPSYSKTDTRDAALLLASIKKLDVKESICLSSSQMPNMPNLEKLLFSAPKRPIAAPKSTVTPVGESLSQLCSAFDEAPRHKKEAEGRNTHVTARARAVSVDSHHFSSFVDNERVGSSFHTDALPRDKISLDLTSDRDEPNITARRSLPVQISPPSSPMLQSYRVSKQNGPQGMARKKRQIDHLNVVAEPIKKKRKHKARPSILRSKESSTSTKGNTEKKILRKKFSWKTYPELEDFLIANREEYLRHSAMNYTMQQKEYNNRLTERLLELASESGYVFDEESFSFVSIRDRIRCYFKSYVQSKKKRGLILGYAARRKGLITEEELEKSAGIKGTIIVPKKSNQKSSKASL